MRPTLTSRVVGMLCTLLAPALAQADFGDLDCYWGPLTLERPANMVTVAVESGGVVLIRMDYFGISSVYRVDGAGVTSTRLLGDSFGLPVFDQLDDRTDVVLADGRLLFLRIAGGVSRYSSAGELDAGFGAGGRATVTGFTRAMAGPLVQSDGRFLAAGVVGGGAGLVRFNADGSPDASFGVGGVVLHSGATAFVSLAVQPDGRVLALTSDSLVRYLSTGQIDTTFGAQGRVSLSTLVTDAVQVRLQSGGGILVAGKKSASAPTIRVLRLTENGDPDTRVGGGTGYRDVAIPAGPLTAWTRPMFVLPDGRPLLVGTIGSNAGGLVRYGADLSDERAVSLGFSPRGVYALADGRMLVGEWEGKVRRLMGDTAGPACTTSSTTLSSAPNPSVPSQVVTLSATVASSSGVGTPTGSVQFRFESGELGSPVTLANGTATLNVSSLTEGPHVLTAIYSGGGGFLSSTSPPFSHTVNGRLTINDLSANSALGAANLNFTVTLSRASAVPVSVSYATADRTAKAGTDYTATSGVLTFSPGELSKTIAVPILAQTVPGPSKDFFVTLTSPANATLAKGAGLGTITFAAPGGLSVHVDDPLVAEGSSGTTLIGFTVSLSRAESARVSVDYRTADGTAIAGADYSGVSGTVAFAPGQTQRFVVVPVRGNVSVNANKSFVLNLTNPVGTAIAKGQGTGTIVEDDPAPAASTVAQYRLYSEVTKEHLYTTDANEYAVLGTRNWNQEGTAYTMFRDGGSYLGEFAVPLYRLYHSGILQHHWTTDAHEVTVLAALGSWDYEGIAGYVLPNAANGAIPLYRMNLEKPPLHLWTTDTHEYNVLSTRGWVKEGVIGYVIP